MEIQGNDIVLSLRDINHAIAGLDAVGDPEFHTYVSYLHKKMGQIIPENEQMPADGSDAIGLLRVPYSRRSAEMLGVVIAHGAVMNEEADSLLREIRAQEPIASMRRQAGYARQARQRQKSRFRVVRHED